MLAGLGLPERAEPEIWTFIGEGAERRDQVNAGQGGGKCCRPAFISLRLLMNLQIPA